MMIKAMHNFKTCIPFGKLDKTKIENCTVLGEKKYLNPFFLSSNLETTCEFVNCFHLSLQLVPKQVLKLQYIYEQNKVKT